MIEPKRLTARFNFCTYCGARHRRRSLVSQSTAGCLTHSRTGNDKLVSPLRLQSRLANAITSIPGNHLTPLEDKEDALKLSKTRHLLGVSILLSLTLLSACTAGHSERDHITASDIRAMSSTAPESQKDALADGKVTYSEYEASVNAARDCYADLGYPAGAIVAENGALTFGGTLTAPATGDSTAYFDKARKAMDTCDKDFSATVATVWFQQQVLTDDQRAAMRPELVACLASAGITIKPDEKVDAIAIRINEAQSAARPPAAPNENLKSCQEKYSAFFLAPNG